MILYYRVVYWDGTRASTLRVNLLWRTEPGMSLILRLICKIGFIVVVGDANAQGQCRIG